MLNIVKGLIASPIALKQLNLNMAGVVGRLAAPLAECEMSDSVEELDAGNWHNFGQSSWRVMLVGFPRLRSFSAHNTEFDDEVRRYLKGCLP